MFQNKMTHQALFLSREFTGNCHFPIVYNYRWSLRRLISFVSKKIIHLPNATVYTSMPVSNNWIQLLKNNCFVCLLLPTSIYRVNADILLQVRKFFTTKNIGKRFLGSLATIVKRNNIFITDTYTKEFEESVAYIICK